MSEFACSKTVEPNFLDKVKIGYESWTFRVQSKDEMKYEKFFLTQEIKHEQIQNENDDFNFPLKLLDCS